MVREDLRHGDLVVETIGGKTPRYVSICYVEAVQKDAMTTSLGRWRELDDYDERLIAQRRLSGVDDLHSQLFVGEGKVERSLAVLQEQLYRCVGGRRIFTVLNDSHWLSCVGHQHSAYWSVGDAALRSPIRGFIFAFAVGQVLVDLRLVLGSIYLHEGEGLSLRHAVAYREIDFLQTTDGGVSWFAVERYSDRVAGKVFDLIIE